MLLRELKDLVESTSDAAFAVDNAGQIVAWNAAAEILFGCSAADALGRSCNEILRGADECGAVCSEQCSVRTAAGGRRPVGNFDIQVPTTHGPQWCNVSTLHAGIANSVSPYSIHIIRGIDVRKRLELLLRDFIVNEAKLPPEDVLALIATTRSPSRAVDISKRELEVLRLAAKGATTPAIASRLNISRTTVNNHFQNILRKFNAHSRLEAIRRAEFAGLI